MQALWAWFLRSWLVPCMTAPLAGTLLFISQTQNQWQGALLLFCLGFGMGIPLLIASVLGAKFLPKAGDWMHQIKVIFAFLMLGLSLYFIRPLLPDWGCKHLVVYLGWLLLSMRCISSFGKRAVTVALCAPTFIGNAICGL